MRKTWANLLSMHPKKSSYKSYIPELFFVNRRARTAQISFRFLQGLNS
jgi:hypothetical protein